MPLSRLCSSVWFRVQLGALLTLGLRRRAVECTERRLRAEPADVHALATRAQQHVEAGDVASAQVILKRLLQQEPQQSAAWFNLGFLLEQQGQATQAEAAFRRATETAPALDRAWYGLALSLIAQQRWNEAEDALHKSIELQPLNPFGWVQLARLNVRRGESDQALRVIAHLRSFEPRAAALLARETGLERSQAPSSCGSSAT